jgi:hypothetical protein
MLGSDGFIESSVWPDFTQSAEWMWYHVLLILSSFGIHQLSKSKFEEIHREMQWAIGNETDTCQSSDIIEEYIPDKL